MQSSILFKQSLRESAVDLEVTNSILLLCLFISTVIILCVILLCILPSFHRKYVEVPILVMSFQLMEMLCVNGQCAEKLKLITLIKALERENLFCFTI